MRTSWDEKIVKEAKEKVRAYFWLHYNVRLDDLEITSTPGYWQDKKPTKYIYGIPIKVIYAYFDPRRDRKGRFTSPYRTWRILFEAEQKK